MTAPAKITEAQAKTTLASQPVPIFQYSTLHTNRLCGSITRFHISPRLTFHIVNVDNYSGFAPWLPLIPETTTLLIAYPANAIANTIH